MLTHQGRSARRPLMAASSFAVIIYLFASASNVQPIDGHPLERTAAGEMMALSTAKQATKSANNHTNIKSPVPIIGILTQVLRDYKRFSHERHLHLASSYVKWIESAGAQVLPILLNEDDAYYERVFSQTNGLLFPGGDNLLDPNKGTPMMLAAKKLYKLAVEANNRGDYYPIWGTCLGLELLSVLSSGKNVLDSCDSVDVALTMNFVDRGKLFEPNKNSNLKILDYLDYSKFIMDTLKKQPATYNYHRKCLTDAGLKRAKLQDFYRPLAYSHDKNGLKFIAAFEAVNYPFFGVQFHPEKPPFEFTHGKDHYNVPHSRESIEVSRYFGDFFVKQAQRNNHRVANWSDIEMQLIYTDKPMYTAPLGDLYEQRYLFPFSDANNWKTELDILKETPQGSPLKTKGKPHLPEGVSPVKNGDLLIEFLEHVPRDGEIIPEDVHEANKKGADVQLAVYSAHQDKPEPDDLDRTVLPQESAPKREVALWG